VSANQSNRREFLKTSAVAAAVGGVPFWFPVRSAQAFNFKSSSERPIVGCIGTGDRWGIHRKDLGGLGRNTLKYGDCVAVCDVDADRAGRAREKVKDVQAKKGQSRDVAVYEDYRKILDRKDVEVVTIATPDQWHSKIAIEAMQAGKDVYCEKPLTLTIEEGKQIIKVLDQTQRVFQVGTQQRSEMGLLFLKAIALAQAGRIGKIKRVHCVIGTAPTGGPFEVLAESPKYLNWDMWLGQAPRTDYIERRCHFEFRWWYEYAGGKMTDWGVHHVDIAQWAIGMDHSGPTTVEGTAVHPCALNDGSPTVTNVYNTATNFRVNCMFPNGVEVVIMDKDEENKIDNGILFTGERGRFFVNRRRFSGKPVEELKDNPLPDDAITKLYKGKQPGDHMRNFMECVKTRELPISDVYTHHRSITTCHLANIAIRLNRKITWDPKTEMIVGDKETQQWQAREQRKGYEIEV